MKTFILSTILFISLIGNINAQDSTKVELTKETIYKDVKGALIQLGEALKVGAEHVYGILVRQQVVNSIINIIIDVSLLLTVVIGYKLTRNTYKGHVSLYQMRYGHKGEPDLNAFPDIDDTAKGTMAVFEAIITGVVFIAFATHFTTTISETITGFINPEYGALKDIFNMVNK